MEKSTTRRTGLGFKGTKPAAMEPKQESLQMSSLENRVLAGSKRKTQDASLLGKEGTINMSFHGVVEENDISKISDTKVKSNPKINNGIAAKKPKLDKSKVNNEIAKPVESSKGSSTTPEVAKNQDNGEKNHNELEKRTRTRKKTRSKQKNIRKDNRLNEDKPEYLRLGSKNYKGRPLTEVIIIILVFWHNIFSYFLITGSTHDIDYEVHACCS